MTYTSLYLERAGIGILFISMHPYPHNVNSKIIFLCDLNAFCKNSLAADLTHSIYGEGGTGEFAQVLKQLDFTKDYLWPSGCETESLSTACEPLGNSSSPPRGTRGPVCWQWHFPHLSVLFPKALWTFKVIHRTISRPENLVLWKKMILATFC